MKLFDQDKILLEDLVPACKKMGVGIMKMVFRKEDDTPMGAVIVLNGEPTTREVLEAIESLEREWDNE